MGLGYVDGPVSAPNRRRRQRRVRFLVDSGAVYSVLRRADWKALGLKPSHELDFVLADGTSLTRGVTSELRVFVAKSDAPTSNREPR